MSYHDVFLLVDTSGDGFLSCTEVEEFCTLLPNQPPRDEVLKLFQEADDDNSGEIDEMEFTFFCEGLEKMMDATAKMIVEHVTVCKYTSLYDVLKGNADYITKEAFLKMVDAMGQMLRLRNTREDFIRALRDEGLKGDQVPIEMFYRIITKYTKGRTVNQVLNALESWHRERKATTEAAKISFNSQADAMNIRPRAGTRTAIQAGRKAANSAAQKSSQFDGVCTACAQKDEEIARLHGMVTKLLESVADDVSIEVASLTQPPLRRDERLLTIAKRHTQAEPTVVRTEALKFFNEVTDECRKVTPTMTAFVEDAKKQHGEFVAALEKAVAVLRGDKPEDGPLQDAEQALAAAAESFKQATSELSNQSTTICDARGRSVDAAFVLSPFIADIGAVMRALASVERGTNRLYSLLHNVRGVTLLADPVLRMLNITRRAVAAGKDRPDAVKNKIKDLEFDKNPVFFDGFLEIVDTLQSTLHALCVSTTSFREDSPQGSAYHDRLLASCDRALVITRPYDRDLPPVDVQVISNTLRSQVEAAEEKWETLRVYLTELKSVHATYRERAIECVMLLNEAAVVTDSGRKEDLVRNIDAVEEKITREQVKLDAALQTVRESCETCLQKRVETVSTAVSLAPAVTDGFLLMELARGAEKKTKTIVDALANMLLALHTYLDLIRDLNAARQWLVGDPAVFENSSFAQTSFAERVAENTEDGFGAAKSERMLAQADEQMNEFVDLVITAEIGDGLWSVVDTLEFKPIPQPTGWAEKATQTRRVGHQTTGSMTDGEYDGSPLNNNSLISLKDQNSKAIERRLDELMSVTPNRSPNSMAVLKVQQSESPRRQQVFEAKRGGLVYDARTIDALVEKFAVTFSDLMPGFYRITENLSTSSCTRRSNVFMYGTRRIELAALNDRLIVPVGGGYLYFDEFCRKYAKMEGFRLRRDRMKKGLESGYESPEFDTRVKTPRPNVMSGSELLKLKLMSKSESPEGEGRADSHDVASPDPVSE